MVGKNETVADLAHKALNNYNKFLQDMATYLSNLERFDLHIVEPNFNNYASYLVREIRKDGIYIYASDLVELINLLKQNSGENNDSTN